MDLGLNQERKNSGLLLFRIDRQRAESAFDHLFRLPNEVSGEKVPVFKMGTDVSAQCVHLPCGDEIVYNSDKDGIIDGRGKPFACHLKRSRKMKKKKVCGAAFLAFLVVSLLSTLGCGFLNLLARPTYPDVGEKLSQMETIRTFPGDARGYYISPAIILASSVDYYDASEYGEITYQSDDAGFYNDCLSVRNEGDWIQMRTSQSAECVGVQFYGDYADGWVRLYLDDEAIWQANTHFENCPKDAEGNRVVNPDACEGGFIHYVQVEHLAEEVHTLRVVNIGGGETTVCFFGVSCAEPTPPN